MPGAGSPSPAGLPLARAACRHGLGGTLLPPGWARAAGPLPAAPARSPAWGTAADEGRLPQSPARRARPEAVPRPHRRAFPPRDPRQRRAKPRTYVGAAGERLPARRRVGPHGGRRVHGAEPLPRRLCRYQAGAAWPPRERHSVPAPRRDRPAPQAPPLPAEGRGPRSAVEDAGGVRAAGLLPGLPAAMGRARTESRLQSPGVLGAAAVALHSQRPCWATWEAGSELGVPRVKT